NLFLNPNDGSLVTATTVSYPSIDPNFGANPNVVGLAQSNPALPDEPFGTTYGIDSDLRILVKVSPPAAILNTVGSLGLGFTLTDQLGFDISGLTGTAYAVFNSPSSPTLS